MFLPDEYGRTSKELTLITQSTIASSFLGGVFGAVLQSRETYISFMENNQATKFANHLEAKRELSRVMYIAFYKGAFRWGWRIGGFTASYSTLMTVASVYLGRESVLDFIFAGGITGLLFRAHLGPKGMVSGLFVGSVLGTFAGTASTVVLKAGGMSMNDMRNFTKTMRDMRDDKIRDNIRQQMVQEFSALADKSMTTERFENETVAEE